MKINNALTASVIIATLLSSCSHLPSNPSRTTASDHHFPGEMGHDRHYDGPPVDVDRRRGERDPGGMNYCEKYRNETARHVLACTFGIEEAQRMAMGFAGGHGQEEGYMRGFSWGMNKMEKIAEFDPNEMNIGEMQAESFFQSYLTRAQSDGANPGARDGEVLGVSEAKSRFYSAVDSKRMPSSDFSVPPTSYNGVTNAYTTQVGSIPRVEDYLRDVERSRRLRIFDHHGDIYMNHRDRRERSAGDIWTRDGDYHSEHHRFLDGDVAFNIWLELRTPGRMRYDQLNAERAPSQERPPRDPNAPRDPRDPRGPQPTQPQPQPQPPVQVNYQDIFKDAFKQAYAVYAPFFYTRGYYAMIDDGQREGEQVGYAIGSDIARKKGLARGFDLRYQNASRNAYINNFAQYYSKSFMSTYNYYRDNSVLSLNFQSLIGNEEDGIIQPGEEFKVQFKVTNVGAKSSSLHYSVSGDVDEPRSFDDRIEGLSTRSITSDIIGQLDISLEDGSDARVALDVNGLKEMKWQRIQRPIEFTEVSASHSMLSGSGLYNVTLANVSTVPLNGKITLELKIKGVVVKTVVAEAMRAGDRKMYALDFKGIDPLNWINGTIPVEIILKYNDSLFGSRAFTLTGAGDMGAILSYTDLLANEKGVVPAGMNSEDRLNEMKNFILNINAREVDVQVDKNGNDYRTDPQTTIPGKVVMVKNARSDQSAKAKAFYSSLADGMAPLSKKFKSFIFIHPKRDAYLKLMEQIGEKKY